jgi:hypothetical protein
MALIPSCGAETLVPGLIASVEALAGPTFTDTLVAGPSDVLFDH